MKCLYKFVLSVLLAACILAHAQQAPVTEPAGHTSVQPAAGTIPNDPATGTQSRQADMVIGAGDLLQIGVYGAQDFDNKEVRVSQTGDISLPLVGTLKIAGLTVGQAQQLIARRFAEGEYFNNPQVWVFVKEYATQGISVLGEVQKPGIYPLLGHHTLFDAISMAGGTTQKAGSVASITHRNRPAQPETVNISYGPGATISGSVAVYPGDTVVVSRAGIVYVVGDVRLPSGIVLENSKLTVLQAVAMAQGVNPTASLDSAKLIRNTNGRREEISIPLKKILAAKAPDTPLQADDILFIPSSATKSATRRGFETALQLATGVVIYRR